MKQYADVAQMVEHVLGKDEVSGSIPDIGSTLRSVRASCGRPPDGLPSEAPSAQDGQVPKRSNGADCKSAGIRLPRFDP